MNTCLTQRRKGAKKSSIDFFLCAFAPLREASLLLTLCLSIAPANAQPIDIPDFAKPADETAQYTVETLATGLSNPCGLALRRGAPAAGPFELYFSESGAGRVVRITTDKPGEATSVITDFPIGTLRADESIQVGPLGLAFLTKTKLAVGTGGLPQGEEQVRVYSLPEDAAPLKYDQLDHSVGPVAASDRTESGEGDFFSLARIEEDFEKALYAVSDGDEQQGWLLKAAAAGNKLADLQPFVATKQVSRAARPMAVTINPKPRSHYLLVGQAGEIGSERDSVIGFYGPSSGTPALVFKAGLHDIAGLAYSRPGGDLYAVDLALHDHKAGGVYRIDSAEVDGRESCRPVKIATIPRPTSLLFTPDGSLYITAFGSEESKPDGTGVLLRIVPAPNAPKL